MFDGLAFGRLTQDHNRTLSSWKLPVAGEGETTSWSGLENAALPGQWLHVLASVYGALEELGTRKMLRLHEIVFQECGLQ